MTESHGITIFDIAREAEVSIATVSRALGEKPNTASKKQKKVIEIAQKYNYKPSLAAGGLNRGRTQLLGIVMPEILHPFYCEVFNAAAAEARTREYSVVFHRIADGDEGYQSFLDLLIRQRPDGLMLAGGLVENAKGPSKLQFLQHLQKYMPVVILGQSVEGFICPCVSIDLAEATRASVRHLDSLGHKRIAFIGGDPINRSSGERESGYYEEMRRLGLDADYYEHHEGGYSPLDGEIGVVKLLTRLRREQWPTAIIAINDLVALGAIRQLIRMGLRVPDDMAVVGCDNHFYGAYVNPPLTTVDLGTVDAARAAMMLLLDPPAMGTESLVHRREPALIVRESCGAKLGRRHG
ncbi:MAG: LacI family transcriptional regulator [Oscillospiraceae bacterium]|jgi:DNA-binding LacI/PurR family transcriptional regulator|nr:LacI family transcriptional regulator [Oscillospiraceae bacterium]